VNRCSLLVLVLAFAFVACHREPEKITRADSVDAAPSATLSSTPPPPVAPPAPLRPMPTGTWWSADRARIELAVYAKTAKLSEHIETERAPLIAEGPYVSKMARDGSFNVSLTVDTLERKFLSRCLDCKSKDVWERLDNASLDGQPVAKGAVVELTITFSENDRVAEMCFTSSKKCERLTRG